MDVSPVAAATNTTVSATPAPSTTFGNPVTFDATVTPQTSSQSTPTGSVYFMDGSTVLNPDGATLDSSGNATFTTDGPALKAGNHQDMTAVYLGDSNFSGSTSNPVDHLVNQATPTVSVTDAGGTYNGMPFPATALVAGVIPGVDDTPAPSLEGVSPTVTYYDDNGNPLSGAPSAVGTYKVAATFPGSADYTSASSSTGAPTTFTIAPNTPGPPPVPPQIVLNTATVTDATDVALKYAISQANVVQPLPFNVYQSDQGFLDPSSVLLGQTTLPLSDTTDLSPGSHTINLALSAPIAANLAMPFIVVVADPDGSVQEASGSVNTVAAIDLSPLELQADGGFTLDRQTNQYTASGTIRIGLEPAPGQSFQPLLQLSGSASYNSTTIQLEGTVSAHIVAITSELFEGSWSIGVGQSSANGIQPSAGSQTLTLGGLSVSVESLVLSTRGIDLRGKISLPTAGSANAGPFAFAASGALTISVSGDNSILISGAGISISGGQLELPDTTLTHKNISFATSGLTAVYEAATPQAPDSFTVQGTATISSPFGALQADFSAPNNSIVIMNGQASFAGMISISNVPALPSGWALNNAFIKLNTVVGTLAAGGSLHVPIGSGFDLSATLDFVQGQLNSVMVGANFANGQQIGTTPIFLRSISGVVKNLANAGSQPITIEGDLVLAAGPVVNIQLPPWLGGPISGSVMQLAIHGSLTADEVTGTATLTVVGGVLANGQGSLDLNLDTGAFRENGSLSLLDGLVSTSVSLAEDGYGVITLSGSATVTLPGFSLLGFSFPATQLAGGTISLQYNPVGPLTSDFVIATGTDNLFGTGSYGLKVDFAGNVTQFDPVITTSVLQSALATNTTPTFQVSAGTDLRALISAVNGLSSPASPATITVNLGAGSFSDVAVNPPAGVTVVLIGNGSTTTIVGHSPALTLSAGDVIVIGVTFTTASDAQSILVTGGSLMLRDDTVEESTGFADAAITLTRGTLDLGTAASPGNNMFNVNGTGTLIRNTTGSPVPAFGDTFENNGVATPSIFVLNPTADGALTISGNSSISIAGPVVVESSSKKAISASGSAVPNASATGVSVPDPLGGLPALTTTASPVSFSLAGNASQTINPGVYSQIKVSGNAVLTMNPGIYIIAGGGFAVTGNASVATGSVLSPDTGTGVLIYNAGSNVVSGSSGQPVYGGITLSGEGSFSLIAPTVGPYTGVLIFQARDNTRALSFSGNAILGTSGTIYAPSALLSMSGNTQLQASLVVGTLNLSGNVALTQKAAGSDGPGDTSGIANTLLAGDLTVYINDPSGLFSADELARIHDAINAWDNLLAPYNVTIAEVSDPTLANMVLDTGTTSACGGAADGVLGCYNVANNEITLIQGWNWYAGADAPQISADQYDFETTVLHELGHALGLGGATDPSSPMYETLPTGIAHRVVTTQDLNIPDPPAGSDPLTAVGFQFVSSVFSTSQNSHVGAPFSASISGPTGLMSLLPAGLTDPPLSTGLVAQQYALPASQPTVNFQTGADRSLALQRADGVEQRVSISRVTSLSTNVVSPPDPLEQLDGPWAQPPGDGETGSGDSVLFEDRTAEHASSLFRQRTSIVFDRILEELADERVLTQVLREEAATGMPAIPSAGSGEMVAGHRQALSHGWWLAPAMTMLMAHDDSPRQSSASAAWLAKILLAFGFCGHGVGSLMARNEKAGRQLHRRRFPKLRPRTI
jgi:hypothetical protein